MLLRKISSLVAAKPLLQHMYSDDNELQTGTSFVFVTHLSSVLWTLVQLVILWDALKAVFDISHSHLFNYYPFP